MFIRSYENDYDQKHYFQRMRTSPPSPDRSPPVHSGGRDSNGDAADIWFRLWKMHLQQSSPHLYNSATKTKSWSHFSPLPDRRAMSAGNTYRVGLGVFPFQVIESGFEAWLPILFSCTCDHFRHIWDSFYKMVGCLLSCIL